VAAPARHAKGSSAGRSLATQDARTGAPCGAAIGPVAFASQQEVGATEEQGAAGSEDPWLAGIPAQQSPDAIAAPALVAIPSSIAARTRRPARRRMDTITIG
jgi:hypothetical protein